MKILIILKVVKLVDNSTIRPGAIYSTAKVGNNTRTGHNFLIRENTIIGDGCLIGTNVVIDNDCNIEITVASKLERIYQLDLR